MPFDIFLYGAVQIIVFLENLLEQRHRFHDNQPQPRAQNRHDDQKDPRHFSAHDKSHNKGKISISGERMAVRIIIM